MIDQIPGLIYREGFLTDAEQHDVLSVIDAQEWLTELSRRVQHYGYKYDYKAKKIDESFYVGPLPDFAQSIAHKLVDEKLMTEIPDQMIVNEYQPGRGIGMHIDCEPCFNDEIATISLGSVYEMDMQEVKTKKTVSFPLPLGSCLVFTWQSRYEWKHGIKRRKKDHGVPRGRRVSLTFRKVSLL